jgi:hypothetical protein
MSYSGLRATSERPLPGGVVLRALRSQGHANVIALKATGTAVVCEIAAYRDFGAFGTFDSVDFGLPATYPAGREELRDVFDAMLDFCLSLPADALVVECGGDFLGVNEAFLTCLKARRSDLKIVLAAADALGAMGAKQALAEIGLVVNLITGPCTDTPVMRQRTEALCGIPALTLIRGPIT